MNREINVKWSIEVILITIIVAIILLGIEISLIANMVNNGFSKAKMIACVAILISFVFCFNAPLSVTLNDSQFILKKLIGKIVIDYTQMKIVVQYPTNYTDIRVFGSGGFCGYIGIFSNKKIGRYYSYVGSRNQSFLIGTQEGRKYVFSCEDSNSVIELLKTKCIQ